MNAKERASMIERFEGLLAFFEKNRFNLISGTLLLFSYILLRGLFEWTLFKQQDSPYIYVGLYNAYQAGFVFTLMFAAGILVMALISRIKVRTITNVVLIGFVFSVMGPLIDSFMFGRTEGYEYVTLEDFSGAGMGLVFQLVLIGIFGGLYVGIKTESLKHATATLAGLMGCMFFMGIIPTYIFETLREYNFAPDERQAAVAVILFILTLIAAALLVYVADRRIPPALLRKARLKFLLLFVLISIAGLAASGKVFIKPVEGEAVTVSVNDLPFAMLLVITVLFACQFFFFLENIRNMRTISRNRQQRREVLTLSQMQQYAGFCAIISLGFAGTLGTLSFLTIIILILMGLVYYKFLNNPNRIAASLATGFAGTLIYVTGFLTTTTTVKEGWLVSGPFEMRYPAHGSISLSTAAIAVGIGIFILVSILWFYQERHKQKG